MKKLILPLLLLVAIGMLSAVESAPSEIVGYVKYDCLTGLNLVALPMDQGLAWASDLANAYPGYMDQISYWDASFQDWVTATDLGGFWDGDFAVGNGSVLMANAISPFALLSIGDMYATQATYTVLAGLNTVMIPLNRSDLAWGGDAGTEMGADQVSYWDASFQDWVTATDLGGFWDGDFAVTIGAPMMANILAPGTWPTRSAGVMNNSRNSK